MSVLNYPAKNTTSFRISRAKGIHLFDERGLPHMDLCLGAGSQILGHCNDQVGSAIADQIKNSVITIAPHLLTETCSETLESVFPSPYKDYVFASTGTEATQRAIRYARAVTGKDLIACLNGSWHGMNEWVLHGDGGRLARSNELILRGIPKGVRDYQVVGQYGDENFIDHLIEDSKKIACIIIEPIMGGAPHLNLTYLRKLTSACKKAGIITIYDEIITGFRSTFPSISTSYKLCPDIIVFGKILGGGLPVGLVVLENTFKQRLSDAYDSNILTGGTFSANPLILRAVNEVIPLLRRIDYDKLAQFTTSLTDRLNELFEKIGVNFKALTSGNIIRLAYTRKEYRDRFEREIFERENSRGGAEFRNKLLEEMVFMSTNSLIFLSILHGPSDLDEIVDRFERALRRLYL
jgi:glutamate-1-semialdehyde 2,1-aminomutase